MALFTIITQTGYLLVAQIRPHLTLFLSFVMCHFALISSLVLLSAQFYGLFPHFHSLYLSLCHFVQFFFFHFPPPSASLSRLTSSSWPRTFPLIKKPPWLLARTRLHRAQRVKPASNLMNYNWSIHGGVPAPFVLRRIQV